MKAELVLKSTDRQETFPLTNERVTIGRSIHTHIRLMDKLVSREHCEIVRMGERYILRDLGSSNGTIVNGKAVSEKVLEWGDKLQVGETVLVFLVEAPNPDGTKDVEVTPGAAVEEERSVFLPLTEVDFREAAGGAIGPELPRLLYDAAREVLSKESVPQACAAYLRLLLRIGRFGRAAVVLFDSTGEVVERFTKAGPDAKRHGIQLEAGALRRIFENRETFRRGGEEVDEMTYSSLLAPILGKDRVHGAAYVDDLTALSPLRDGDVHLLGALSGMVGCSLDALTRVQTAREERENLRRWIAAENEIVGDTESMQQVLDLVGEAAKADVPVLVRGEGGTGKELIARAVHLNSRRAGAPFGVFHCASLAPESLEVELFGHEKDALPGAVVRRKGRIETAQGGTLFLDSVGELPQECQLRLARFLEEHRILRLGGTDPVPLDVRIIAGTTRDLSSSAARGAFREELLSRLGAIEIVIPPLRDRREDIPLLVRAVLDDLTERMGRRVEGLNEAAQALFLHHEWAGNVRELRNVLERAALLPSSPTLVPEDFPSLLQGRTGSREAPRSLDEVEREHVLRVLRLVGGNQAEAARLLGLSRTALQERLTRYGIGG